MQSNVTCVLAQAHLVQLMKPLVTSGVLETTAVLQIGAGFYLGG